MEFNSIEDEECSPLFNYMKEEVDEVCFHEAEAPKKNRTIGRSKKSVKNMVREYFFNFRSSLVDVFTNRKYSYVLSKFECSSVLLEEDTKLISYLFKEFENNTKQLTVFEVVWLHQWIFHILFLLVVILIAFFKFANACFFIFLLSLVMVLFIFHPALEVIYRFNKLSDSLLTILANVEVFHAFSRKVMLYIQEADIVARGFVFVSNNASSGPAGATFDTARTRRCPQLRRSLFAALRKSIYHLRDATSTLCDLVPSEQSHDLMHCIARIPLSDFGPCLSLPDVDELGLEKVSDNYSLASLKAMNELANMHCSEFLRKLCVTSHPNRIVLKGFNNCVKDLIEAVTSCEALLVSTRLSLKEQFDLNQYCLERTIKSKESFEKDQRSENNPNHRRFFVAVHSLNLHLQAAIFKVFELEKLLNSDVEQKAELDRLLQIVGSEIQAACLCLDESRICFDNGEKCETQNSHSLNTSVITKASDERENAIKTNIMMCDPIIQDEVLEALVEADDISCQEDVTSVISSEIGSSVEALRVLSELRSVIARRARDRRVREYRAIRRRAGLPESPYISSDDSEEDSKIQNSTLDEVQRERAEARDALQAQYNAPSNVELLRDWKHGAMAAAAARIDFSVKNEDCFEDSDDDDL